METQFNIFLSIFNFKKISIDDMQKSFINEIGENASKQKITKMLFIEAKKKGFELVKKSDGKKRYYDFIKQKPILNKELLLSMQPNESFECDDTKENKALIIQSKYYTNSRFRIKECEDGLTRIFRTQ